MSVTYVQGEARWPGSCSGCGDEFASGTLIIHDGSYGHSGYRAECCAD